MGNVGTKAAEMTASTSRKALESASSAPLPISDSSTVSSQSDQGVPSNETCALSYRGRECIPSVLTFYRKGDPFLLRPSNEADDHESDDDDERGPMSLPRGHTPRKESIVSCSTRTRRRQRSWSPSASRKLSFLSKYAPGSSSTSSLSSLLPSQLSSCGYNEEELAMEDGHLPTTESDLNRLRDYFIVTTAALPWFTGTAVNPALRAASLSSYQRRQFSPNRSTVTLVVPWLEEECDRIELYGQDWQDKKKADQEAYIRDWLAHQANFPDEALPPSEGGIRILFYPARYHSKLSSIFAMGDLCEFIVTQNNLTIGEDAVCVLEEPEHVHFYRAQHWRNHFSFVCGVIHTNYRAYASSAMIAGSFITGPLVGTISSWLVRAYCDKVIKLSPVLQSFDCPEKEEVCNVHGIRHDFIQEGERRAEDSVSRSNGSKIYFIGKLLWAKGLDKLLELESLYHSITGEYFPIDVYGSGPEQDEIEQAFLSERPKFLVGSQSFASSNDLESISPTKQSDSLAELNTSPTSNSNSAAATTNSRLGFTTTYYSTFVRPRPPVPAQFMGRKDHALLTRDYKIFVNPSITEVLCTTTAEATAMGKFVIIPDHPSNTFFHRFPNCLLYKSKLEFVEFIQYAISHEPEPLRPDLIHQLTWEAATERFIKASIITRRDAKWRERLGKTKSDEKIAKMHYELGKGAKGDVLRKVLGGGPVADQFEYDTRRIQQAEEVAEESTKADISIDLDSVCDSAASLCV